MFGEDDLVKQHKTRSDIIANIVLFSFVLILSRLWYLQIYKGKEFYTFSLQNRLRKEVVKAPRGMVFSRDGQLLVHNIPRFDAAVIPQYLSDKDGTVRKLAKILNLTPEQIMKTLKKNRGQAKFRSVIVKKNISRREVAIIETENSKMPGVIVREFISREYIDKEVGGHLLGYISEISKTQLPILRNRDSLNYKLGDFIGKAGLEQEFDLFLRGDDGFTFMEVDARGRMKRSFRGQGNLLGEIENKPQIPGNNIRLTIDRDLQLAGYKALEGKVGSAVAVKIKTGEILAMVSRPSFDPSQFSRGLTSEYWSSLVNNDKNPLRDRTIQEHYSPGSTFKTITAIAALEEGVVDENTEVNCKGSFRLGRRKFHCWKKYGHGKVNLNKSVQQSCDVYYYKIATMMDIDILAKYAKALGLGSKTNIRLPRETKGLIPTREWKKKKNGEVWVKGETLSCVIGQSFVLTTPLQLAMSYAAIGNGGKLLTPYLIKEIFSHTGEVLKKGEAKEIPQEIKLSEKTLKLVREGLFDAVNTRKGTAWWHRGRGIRMAGKTGTSQVVSFSADKLFEKCEDKEYRFRHHGVFAAFAPVDDPEIAVSVVVEHGCHGSSAASPVAKEIITAYLKKYETEKFDKHSAEDRSSYMKLIREQKRLKDLRDAEKEAEKVKEVTEEG